jgi:flagellar motility protein MotE (MotC chaperone)
MGKLFERVMILFLASVVVLLGLVVLAFMDYTGFLNIRDKLMPDEFKKNRIVREYVKWAEINALSPKEQKVKVIEEREKYVEKLLKKMKLESTKVLEEKQRLEQLFRKLEEEREAFKQEQGQFDAAKKAFDTRKKQKDDEQWLQRIEGLAAAYQKMEPAKVGDILKITNPKDAYEVLKRLKPKTLGQILQTMEPDDAKKYVKLLQEKP